GGAGGGGGGAAVPVTNAVAAPPFHVKFTLVPKPPAEMGLNCTTTVWLPPGPRTNELPETTVNGPLVAAAPLTVLVPEFVAVNERSATFPMVTDPKSWAEGVITNLGGGAAAEVAPEMTCAVAA